MDLDEYQAEARRTAPRALDAYPVAVRGAHDSALFKLHDVLIWALGLAGEAGEVADLLKKVHGHGKPMDPDALKKELGDCLWYLSNLADAHGFKLSEVARANIDKLRARYPDGFTVAAAQAKADERPVDWAAYARQASDNGPLPRVEKFAAVHVIPRDANGRPIDDDEDLGPFPGQVLL